LDAEPLRIVGSKPKHVHASRLVSGLTAVFAGTAVVFAVLGVVQTPALFAVAGLFGAVAYLTWYHASGRLARRVYRGVERQAATTDGGRGDFEAGRGGFGAGPREEWRPPGDGGRAAGRANRRRTARQGTRAPDADEEPRPADYQVLGLEPGADESAVREAYRSKVKEVHPDAEGGDEESFKRVQRAYERLTGEAA